MRRAMLCLMAGGLAACTPRVHTDPATGRTVVNMRPITQRGLVWETTLQPQGGSGVGGSARAEVHDDMTMPTVTVTGAAPGSTLPWHVHDGTCATGGGVVGDASAYTPIAVGNDGRGESSAHLSLTLNQARRYHVNVHASPADMGTIVACGDLKY